MTENSKVRPTHTQRAALVYVRQSTASQVEHNRESTDRQYALVGRAVDLGWQREQVTVIDEDLGLSGSGTAQRSGFTRLTSEVALRHAGIVLGLEVSRLARTPGRRNSQQGRARRVASCAACRLRLGRRGW